MMGCSNFFVVICDMEGRWGTIEAICVIGNLMLWRSWERNVLWHVFRVRNSYMMSEIWSYTCSVMMIGIVTKGVITVMHWIVSQFSRGRVV